MAESLLIDHSATKEEKYQAILPQIEALVSGEEDTYANLSNIAAALKEAFEFFWVGFYLVKGEQLVLGPFQGPIACTRINYGKGVCGTAWEKKKTLVVPNVDEFPGHIACSSGSKSEIVVPCIKENEVKLVLDIDSDNFASFDEVDARYLEELMPVIAKFL